MRLTLAPGAHTTIALCCILVAVVGVVLLGTAAVGNSKERTADMRTSESDTWRDRIPTFEASVPPVDDPALAEYLHSQFRRQAERLDSLLHRRGGSSRGGDNSAPFFGLIGYKGEPTRVDFDAVLPVDKLLDYALANDTYWNTTSSVEWYERREKKRVGSGEGSAFAGRNRADSNIGDNGEGDGAATTTGKKNRIVAKIRAACRAAPTRCFKYVSDDAVVAGDLLTAPVGGDETGDGDSRAIDYIPQRVVWYRQDDSLLSLLEGDRQDDVDRAAKEAQLSHVLPKTYWGTGYPIEKLSFLISLSNEEGIFGPLLRSSRESSSPPASASLPPLTPPVSLSWFARVELPVTLVNRPPTAYGGTFFFVSLPLPLPTTHTAGVALENQTETERILATVRPKQREAEAARQQQSSISDADETDDDGEDFSSFAYPPAGNAPQVFSTQHRTKCLFMTVPPRLDGTQGEPSSCDRSNSSAQSVLVPLPRLLVFDPDHGDDPLPFLVGDLFSSSKLNTTTNTGRPRICGGKVATLAVPDTSSWVDHLGYHPESEQSDELTAHLTVPGLLVAPSTEERNKGGHRLLAVSGLFAAQDFNGLFSSPSSAATTGASDAGPATVLVNNQSLQVAQYTVIIPSSSLLVISSQQNTSSSNSLATFKQKLLQSTGRKTRSSSGDIDDGVVSGSAVVFAYSIVALCAVETNCNVRLLGSAPFDRDHSAVRWRDVPIINDDDNDEGDTEISSSGGDGPPVMVPAFGDCDGEKNNGCRQTTVAAKETSELGDSSSRLGTRAADHQHDGQRSVPFADVLSSLFSPPAEIFSIDTESEPGTSQQRSSSVVWKEEFVVDATSSPYETKIHQQQTTSTKEERRSDSYRAFGTAAVRPIPQKQLMRVWRGNTRTLRKLADSFIKEHNSSTSSKSKEKLEAASSTETKRPPFNLTAPYDFQGAMIFDNDLRSSPSGCGCPDVEMLVVVDDDESESARSRSPPPAATGTSAAMAGVIGISPPWPLRCSKLQYGSETPLFQLGGELGVTYVVLGPDEPAAAATDGGEGNGGGERIVNKEKKENQCQSGEFFHRRFARPVHVGDLVTPDSLLYRYDNVSFGDFGKECLQHKLEVALFLNGVVFCTFAIWAPARQTHQRGGANPSVSPSSSGITTIWAPSQHYDNREENPLWLHTEERGTQFGLHYRSPLRAIPLMLFNSTEFHLFNMGDGSTHCRHNANGDGNSGGDSLGSGEEPQGKMRVFSHGPTVLTHSFLNGYVRHPTTPILSSAPPVDEGVPPVDGGVPPVDGGVPLVAGEVGVSESMAEVSFPPEAPWCLHRPRLLGGEGESKNTEERKDEPPLESYVDIVNRAQKNSVQNALLFFPPAKAHGAQPHRFLFTNESHRVIVDVLKTAPTLNSALPKLVLRTEADESLRRCAYDDDGGGEEDSKQATRTSTATSSTAATVTAAAQLEKITFAGFKAAIQNKKEKDASAPQLDDPPTLYEDLLQQMSSIYDLVTAGESVNSKKKDEGKRADSAPTSASSSIIDAPPTTGATETALGNYASFYHLWMPVESDEGASDESTTHTTTTTATTFEYTFAFDLFDADDHEAFKAVVVLRPPQPSPKKRVNNNSTTSAALFSLDRMFAPILSEAEIFDSSCTSITIRRSRSRAKQRGGATVPVGSRSGGSEEEEGGGLNDGDVVAFAGWDGGTKLGHPVIVLVQNKQPSAAGMSSSLSTGGSNGIDAGGFANPKGSSFKKGESEQQWVLSTRILAIVFVVLVMGYLYHHCRLMSALRRNRSSINGERTTTTRRRRWRTPRRREHDDASASDPSSGDELQEWDFDEDDEEANAPHASIVVRRDEAQQGLRQRKALGAEGPTEADDPFARDGGDHGGHEEEGEGNAECQSKRTTTTVVVRSAAHRSPHHEKE